MAVSCSIDLWDSVTASSTEPSAVSRERIQFLSAPDTLDKGAFADGFAWLVSLPEIPIEILAGPAAGAEIRRPRRFAVCIPVRYWLAGDNEWSYGITDSLSHSGLAFQTDRAAADLTLSSSPGEAGPPIEVILSVPQAGRPGQSTDVRCMQARMVRTSPQDRSRRMTVVAIAVVGYVIE